MVKGYSTLLTDVTIYTSLESCAQCSGIMTLGSVKEIVYLQWDQGEFLIGNLMYNATSDGRSGFRAPRPVPGDAFDFDYFARLNAGNVSFEQEVRSTPFYVNDGFRVDTLSVTSVPLHRCGKTSVAGRRRKFQTLTTATFPDYVPAGAISSALTNAEVVREVQNFAVYAQELDDRGTPHRV